MEKFFAFSMENGLRGKLYPKLVHAKLQMVGLVSLKRDEFTF
jgi:hypothetical protein